MRTKADLTQELRTLYPYQAAFFALRRGAKPIKLKDGNPNKDRRRKVELLDPGAPHGGIVIEGASCQYSGDWCAAANLSRDVWAGALVGQILQLQREAWEAA